jgi:hypothetical protein
MPNNNNNLELNGSPASVKNNNSPVSSPSTVANNNNNNNNNKNKNANNTTAKAANNTANNKGKNKTKKAPSAKTLQRKENQKIAKSMLNNALGINSKPKEYNPIVTYLRKKYNSEKERVGDIDDHIEVIRKQRAEKNAAAAATKKNKPEKKPKKKRTTVSKNEATYKANMKAAKAMLNAKLSIKSTPPEHNPIARLMRNKTLTNNARQAAINAHIQRVKEDRNASKATGARVGRLKKPEKPKNATRKNRRS